PELTGAPSFSPGQELASGLQGDKAARIARTQEVLDSIGAHCHPQKGVGELPLAQRQLVQIGRALLQPRKVVIFDEPTAVLADDEVAALLDVVRKLKARGVDRKSTRLNSSHVKISYAVFC